jgi:dCTP deaminase
VILTGCRIVQEWHRGVITIDPFDERHVNPNSYNFHLHGRILKKDKATENWQMQTIGERGIVLSPLTLYLAATAEVIGSEDYVVTLLGKSSVGRLGIFLNITADLGHLGCRSRWTLEITVVQRVRVYPGMCIGQVAFWRATSSQPKRYEGRYHRHLQPVPNRDLALLIGTP